MTTYTVVNNGTGEVLGTLEAKNMTAAFNKAYKMFPTVPRYRIGIIEE